MAMSARLREIEERVLPSMPGMEYLGPEYDPTAMAYRLKFIRDGRVVFVDVDARTRAQFWASHTDDRRPEFLDR